jgi:hypothetical protein
MGRAQAVSALACALALLFAVSASGAQKADHVLVVKSERRLYLMKGDKVLAAYTVTFGGEPKGHKQQQGDGRTPEGHYLLDSKNVNSSSTNQSTSPIPTHRIARMQGNAACRPAATS